MSVQIEKLLCTVNGQTQLLDVGDLIAIKNVMELAKERVWLSQDKPPGYEFDRFRETLDLDEENIAVESIQRVNSIFNRLNHGTPGKEVNPV
jgi:hypothetical protein